MPFDKQYTSTGLVNFTSKGNDNVITPSGDSTDSRDYIHIKSYQVGNSSGANASCGLAYRLPDAMWKAGLWDDSETASYTDDTTDAQDAGTADFAMSTTTNSDGFVVQCRDKFSIIGMDIGTAGSGGGIATKTWAYWNGTAWTTFTPVNAGDFTNNSTYEYAVLGVPGDWTKLASADTPVATDGLTAGMYAVRCVWGTAPTTAPVADSIWLLQLIDYVEIVADGSSITKEFGDFKVPFRSKVVPWCSTANAANWCTVEYRMGG